MRLFRIANPYTQMRSDYKSDRTGGIGEQSYFGGDNRYIVPKLRAAPGNRRAALNLLALNYKNYL